VAEKLKRPKNRPAWFFPAIFLNKLGRSIRNISIYLEYYCNSFDYPNLCQFKTQFKSRSLTKNKAMTF
jgi:hypothetical protein